MQAKDISDTAVLEFLAGHQGTWSTHGEGYTMPTVQDAMPPGTPLKVQLAKMRALHRRKLVGGCPCGCRGDWEITDKGLRLVKRERVKAYNGYDPDALTNYRNSQTDAFDITREQVKNLVGQTVGLAEGRIEIKIWS